MRGSVYVYFYSWNLRRSAGIFFAGYNFCFLQGV